MLLSLVGWINPFTKSSCRTSWSTGGVDSLHWRSWWIRLPVGNLNTALRSPSPTKQSSYLLCSTWLHSLFLIQYGQIRHRLCTPAILNVWNDEITPVFIWQVKQLYIVWVILISGVRMMRPRQRPRRCYIFCEVSIYACKNIDLRPVCTIATKSMACCCSGYRHFTMVMTIFRRVNCRPFWTSKYLRGSCYSWRISVFEMAGCRASR